MPLDIVVDDFKGIFISKLEAVALLSCELGSNLRELNAEIMCFYHHSSNRILF